MEDTYRHQGMRRKLIADLRERGIRDERVLAAMGEIPRHFFLDKAFEEWAYQDKPFPIGAGQTISQPYTVAFMTELLEVRKRDKVLEIGTGSGYQAAVLAALGARVFSVERHKALYVAAKALLEKMELGRIRLFLRDGYKGLPEFAPFDRIIVTAGAPQIPEALKAQLGIGGILVIPVGEDYQTMLKVTRRAEDDFVEEEKGSFRFVPFLGGIE
ncbi:MAG: protein-L-isoaspartate(D-aspartate) O-methyltransferase [Saprospiraceae bacterium]